MYDLAIKQLKNRFPEYKNVRFELNDGELSYWVSSHRDSIDMEKLQDVVNEILGQRMYKAELVCYEYCYATSEKEAREFINRIKPKTTYIKECK